MKKIALMDMVLWHGEAFWTSEKIRRACILNEDVA